MFVLSQFMISFRSGVLTTLRFRAVHPSCAFLNPLPWGGIPSRARAVWDQVYGRSRRCYLKSECLLEDDVFCTLTMVPVYNECIHADYLYTRSHRSHCVTCRSIRQSLVRPQRSDSLPSRFRQPMHRGASDASCGRQADRSWRRGELHCVV